ncbi:hypothetical protein [Nocardioides alcanivorans]|uniref:hypothetical protein n=1 Tax=Nocardioides alcanivorans TaxID=2897352 RepID=UPI001F259328|nr:hypothetical protein [Nocardioides alcanivorans]
MTESPPERVRVTGPPRRPTRRRTRSGEIDDQTALGEVLMGSLLRAQLRLAIGLLVPLVLLAVGVPLLFHLWPELAAREVLKVPVAWLLLGFAVYPALFALGTVYVRRAERNERDFAELLETAEG